MDSKQESKAEAKDLSQGPSKTNLANPAATTSN